MLHGAFLTPFDHIHDVEPVQDNPVIYKLALIALLSNRGRHKRFRIYPRGLSPTVQAPCSVSLGA